jgi:hypothetical protein
MPDRRRYGRLKPAEVPHLLEAISRGTIYLPAYKGDPALSELQQCAEVAARQAWSAEEPNAIDMLTIERQTETEASIRVEAKGRVLAIRLERALLNVHSNCRDLDEPAKQTLRWRIKD